MDDLRLLHSDGLSYDREAGIVIVRGTTDAQGRLVDAFFVAALAYVAPFKRAAKKSRAAS
ncbi:hypothetical protein BGI28_23935 [Burkholderia contaminans]|nr:hypothetical protein BGI28_23935 [Burkholderia contaminans]